MKENSVTRRKLVVPNEVLLNEASLLLAQGQLVQLRVKGNSMLPFIRGDRDLVVLQPVRQLKQGDIVLAQLPAGTYVLHRIVKIREKHILLMGDGNLMQREQCLPSDIKGKAIQVITHRKKISCTSLSFRFKGYIWVTLLPIRRYLLAIYRRLIVN